MDHILSTGEKTQRSENTIARLNTLKSLLMETLPKLGPKWDSHLTLFNETASLARILWFNEIFRKLLKLMAILLNLVLSGAHL